MIKNNLQIYFLTWLHGDLVGYDEFGNKYYQDHRRQTSLKKYMRRWVVYSGEADSTTIPATWHGWLHGQCDTLLTRPSKMKITIVQQKNNTGTINAYRPPSLNNDVTILKNDVKSYQAWHPNNNEG